jgi:hypothetical protein
MESPLRVVAYHGTSGSAARAILAEGFVVSANRYDWLGDGTYFFQEVEGFPHSGLEHAWAWALRQHGADPAVLRATIELVDCLDLLDHGWASRLRSVHDALAERAKRMGRDLPRQAGGNHGLDRLLVNYLVGVLADAGRPIRSVRGCFGEDERAAFPRSSLFDLTHVQIAVRDATVVVDLERVEGQPPPPPVPWITP